MRETWQWFGRILKPGEVSGGFSYRADGTQRKFEEFEKPADVWEEFKSAAVEERWNKWRPSIHMPRWASRLVLEITKVRVERLQETSHEDALAEGCKGYDWVDSSPYIAGPHTDAGELPVEEFQKLWDSINSTRDGGKFAWGKNPFVWVLEFKQVSA